MKITYGKRIASDGKVTFDVSHKWAKWTVDEMAVMVMRRVFAKYPDAGEFDWFSDSNGICAGRCKLKV
jgi:hypothetical protein